MSDPQTIARLADLREFDALRSHFDEVREADIQALARKTFASPEHHDRLEWERKKAFHAGVDAVLSLPAKARESQRKEQQQ